jgi:hypothetical protein
MARLRQLKLGAFMRPASIHTGAWRFPGAYPDANFNFTHLKRFAQRLEHARFDAFFMADQRSIQVFALEVEPGEEPRAGDVAHRVDDGAGRRCAQRP